MDDQASSIINQMKAQLVNTSAELLIAKGRIDELEREKKRLSSTVDQNSAAVTAARKEAEAQQATAFSERISHLSAQVTKLNGEVRKAEEERYTYEKAVEREKDVSSSLRLQLDTLQAGAGESNREHGSRIRELQDRVAHLEGEVSAGKSREARLAGERGELQVKVEQLYRASQEGETREASLERDVESLKERLARQVHSSESSLGDSNARLAGLQKRNSELQEALAAAEANVGAARGKLEALHAAKVKADSQVASLSTRASAEKEEHDRLVGRWEATDRRMAEAENEVMALKSQLADAQTQLHIERSKMKTMESLANAHSLGGAGSPSGRSLAQALEAETAQNAALRAALRTLNAEKDAVADILASIGRLPAFVRTRPAENEAAVLSTGASREAASRTAARKAFTYDGEGGEGGSGEGGGGSGLPDSPLRGEGSVSGASLTPSLLHHVGQSSIVKDVQRIAAERPLIIESLNHMDLELRRLQMEKERLGLQLQTSKGAEESKDASLASSKKQLKQARDEILDVSAARDAALERAGKAEGDLRACEADLAAKREALEAERRGGAALAADLDESRQMTTLTRYELDNCRAELERAIASHGSMEKRLKEENVSILHAANAARKDAEVSHEKTLKQLLAKCGSLEGELEGARAELFNTSSRLSTTTLELERTRGEVTSLRSKGGMEEIKLADSEKTRRTLDHRLHEVEGRAQRLEKDLEATLAERDSKSHSLMVLQSQLATMESRLAELESLNRIHGEDEARLALYKERCGELEREVQASRAETESAQIRISSLSQQAHQDLEIAHAATAKVAHELDRLHKRKAAEADELHSLSEQSRSTISSLKNEGDSLAADCQQLRERCRQLQLQAAVLANEVQEEKDKARLSHDGYIKAVADRQTEQERSASLHRSCLEQLEMIKTQFYTFLSMFHPEDGSAPSSASALLQSGAHTLAHPRSPSSSVLGAHLVNSLSEDMAGLKKRLDTLASASLRTANTFTESSGSGGYRTGSSLHLSTPRSPL